MEAMAETKLLNFNMKKSCLIVLGSDKLRKEVERKMEAHPILLYNKPMQIKEKDKYLGEEITVSCANSITATIKKRKGLVMLAINDIAYIINDPRSHTIGSLFTAIKIWEMAIIPFLLNSSGTWTDISNEATKMLEELQKKFLQRILQVKTCPIPLMLWDLGQHLMSNRILKRKLLLIKHIADLDDNSLAHKIYQQQKELKFPGLVRETEEVLRDFGLTLTDMESYSKYEWKILLKELLEEKNRKELLVQMKPYKKIDTITIANEPFEIKDYIKHLDYEDAKLNFRLRSKTCPTIKTHFKSDKKFTDDLWECWECSFLDTSSHILRQCVHYEDIRQQFDLDDDDQKISFFRRVIEEREKKSREEEE